MELHDQVVGTAVGMGSGDWSQKVWTVEEEEEVEDVKSRGIRFKFRFKFRTKIERLYSLIFSLLYIFSDCILSLL